MLPNRQKFSVAMVAAILAMAVATAPARAQIAGALFTGAGPVNRSMGGAAVAAPLDASGALFWNPASISALPSSSMDFGCELLAPHTRLSSSLPPSIFGPGIPPVGLSGSNRGDNGIFPLPTMALVYQPDCSSLTYGLGIFAVGGFGVNYPASATNPILTAQPPNGLGLGSVNSNFQVLEIVPTISWQVNERLSLGFAPTVTAASLRADPLFVASPDDANGDSFRSYPFGTHSQTTWGGGFQAGVFYRLDGGWQVGASLKSTQWLENFRFNTADERGRPRQVNYNLNIPMVASAGVAYTGLDCWTFAADLRYIDYANTNGFKQSGFDPTGAVRGLGWRSIFAASLGAQYQATDALSLRAGYSFNQNPIPDRLSSINVASATIITNAVSVGASYRVSEALSLSIAYGHGFENSITGPLATPFGDIPGTAVRSKVSADFVTIGATVRFGGGN